MKILQSLLLGQAFSWLVFGIFLLLLVPDIPKAMAYGQSLPVSIIVITACGLFISLFIHAFDQ